MYNMLFLLRSSLDNLPVAAVATPLWMALVVLAATGFAAFRRNVTARTSLHGVGRWSAEVGMLIAMPVAMLVIGRYIGAHNQYLDSSLAPYQGIALNTVDVLGIVEVAIAGILVWRHRSRLVSTLLVSGLSLCWTAGALFTAGMAITHRWL